LGAVFSNSGDVMIRKDVLIYKATIVPKLPPFTLLLARCQIMMWGEGNKHYPFHDAWYMVDIQANETWKQSNDE